MTRIPSQAARSEMLTRRTKIVATLGPATDAPGVLEEVIRAGFFDEVMRFYDRYLLGARPAVRDPAYAIEDNSGAWRAQPTWPAPSSYTSANLADGQYVDDGIASALAAPAMAAVMRLAMKSAATSTRRRSSRSTRARHMRDFKRSRSPAPHISVS